MASRRRATDMIDYLGLVREFHKKYNSYTQDKPGVPSAETRDLRLLLVEEESSELVEAINHGHYVGKAIDAKVNLVDVADALADTLVVVFGTALSYGIPIEEVFAEVHRSNMTKSTEKNEYGKTIKGDSFEPPKIAEILEKYMR